jgi:hypothetical protein
MKRILLMAAFAGMLGSAAVANTFGDDKDKGKHKKECCKKGEKACAGEKKEACAKGDAKACCKKKSEASTASAPADNAVKPAEGTK